MKNIFIKTLFFLVLFIVVPIISSAQAASLGFDKTTVTTTNGGTFQVAVTIDPGSDALNSTDIYVTYDPILLKPTAVSAGTMFPTVSNDISTSGKVYIAGMVDDPASSVSTSGTVATITFQGLKDGSGTLSFDCNSSKIVKNDINATNVLVCSSNGILAVTVGGGGGNTTGTEDTTGTTDSSTPTELPQSGIFDNVVKFALPGGILVILGTVLKMIL